MRSRILGTLGGHLLDQKPLFFGQVIGNNDLDLHVLVTMTVTSQVWRAQSRETKCLSTLCARRDFHVDAALLCRDLHLCAQCSFGKGYGKLAMEIVPTSFEESVLLHSHSEVQVTAGPVTSAGSSLPTDSNP